MSSRHSPLRRVRSPRDAEILVAEAGVVSVFPTACAAAPSLWTAVTGALDVTVFTTNGQGRRVLTPDLERVWALKNELAERRRACVGKHIRGRLTLVSPAAVPFLYALTGRPGRIDDFDDPEQLTPLELRLARAVRDEGPQTAPALRRLVASRDARATKRALEMLQRRFIVTQAGEVEQRAGWPAAAFDLVARRFRARLGRLPERRRCVPELAAMLLRSAGELSAADVALALGTSRGDAAAALDRLAEGGRAGRRVEGRFPLWSAAPSKG